MPCGIRLDMTRKCTVVFGDKWRVELVMEKICDVVVVPCKESAGAKQAINTANFIDTSSCRFMKPDQPPSF